MVSTEEVLVIGGGNAALCAAIAARRRGADVLLVERAPVAWRGGNSKYTRNLRHVHGPEADMPGEYTVEEMAADLAKVTGEGANPELTRLAIEASRDAPGFLAANGVKWQAALRGTLNLSHTNRFFLGGGKALVNRLYATAEAIGVRVRYEHTVDRLDFDGTRCVGVGMSTPDGPLTVAAESIVAASGGFEANLQWLATAWGAAARNFYVRGARQNDGAVLRLLLDAGALEQGNPRGFHGIAVDVRGPRFEGGIVTRVDSVPFGIMVNRDAQRFYDEGEDLWPKRYAVWGRLIAGQPDQVAFSVFDSKVRTSFMATAMPPLQADSIGELAQAAGLDAGRLQATVDGYNAAVREGTYDASQLDDCRTVGLSPDKTHWAQRIDVPPFYAFPLGTGVTFTYLGVGIDRTARVRRSDGGAFDNVFAAGEIVAGNILREGYLAGFGMTIGTVFGRLAGESAADAVSPRSARGLDPVSQAPAVEVGG